MQGLHVHLVFGIQKSVVCILMYTNRCMLHLSENQNQEFCSKVLYVFINSEDILSLSPFFAIVVIQLIILLGMGCACMRMYTYLLIGRRDE